jgi:hypothetical protein
MSKTDTLFDLIIACNAVDGTQVSPDYIAENKRCGNTLRSLALKEAERLYRDGVTLKTLDRVLNKGGWESRFEEISSAYQPRLRFVEV